MILDVNTKKIVFCDHPDTPGAKEWIRRYPDSDRIKYSDILERFNSILNRFSYIRF